MAGATEASASRLLMMFYSDSGAQASLDPTHLDLAHGAPAQAGVWLGVWLGAQDAEHGTWRPHFVPLMQIRASHRVSG